LLICVSFGATLVIMVILNRLALGFVLEERNYRYAMLIPQAIRLSLLYVVYRSEERTFQLFQHFGGQAANGMLPLMLGAFMRGPLLSRLPDEWVLFLV
jgi:hypothetical protein